MDAAWFAGRLRELRAAGELSQQELAVRAGLTREGIAQLETGRRSPGWETVVALCKALGVGCDAFLQEPGDLTPAKPGRPPKKPAAESPRKSGRAKKTR